MNKQRAILASTLVVLLAIFTIACTKAKSDAQIIGEVVTRIQMDPQVTNKQIAVNSNNGVVTLSGSAATDAERAAIANDAAQVEGVRTVVNNLLVASVPPGMAQPTTDAQAQEPAPAPKPEPVRERHERKETAYRERRVSPRPVYTPPVTPAAEVYTPPAPAAAPAPLVSSTPAPPPPPRPVTVEPGTEISIRMIDPIDSNRNHPGDMFHATLDTPIMVGETVVVPEGADVTGRVAEVHDAGHFAGKPELALELTSITANGQKYPIQTDQYRQEGKSRGASTAKTVGSGAAIGAIIGAIAGGGKGAAIGAAAGAGMGGGVQAARKAEDVHIESEALLNFRLQNSITLTPSSAPRRHRMQDNSSAQPEPLNNDNNYVNYSDDSTSSGRPILRRRPSSNQN